MTDLKNYREKIDHIDAEITELLTKRFDVAGEIARYKERRGLPVLDAERERQKLESLASGCDSGKEPYIADVFREIMAQSRRYQTDRKLEYGLLGRKLGHSYSPQIHKAIGGYEYGLFEREPEQLDAFFGEGTFRGISVTMPYKKAVMDYCGRLSDRAVKCGSVNTIIRCADGSYFGDNTDYFGFESTVRRSGVSVRGAKAVVLGSGGVSGTVVQVLRDLGAGQVTVISRTGNDNYGNLSRHYDAQIVVNTTPVGMYPDAGRAAVDIGRFTECRAVFDLIYNPLRTKLMLDAADAGIPAYGGLYMLAAQAAEACRLFLGKEFDLQQAAAKACSGLLADIGNIVLIGMPGSGKTTIGRKLAQLTGMPFTDCDDAIRKLYGRSAEQIILEDGVDRFRRIESEVIRKVMRRAPEDDGNTPGIVFATGGGCVESEENKAPLLENSTVVYIERDTAELPDNGRPVSKKEGTEAVYERRKNAYETWSDVSVRSDDRSAEEILRKIRERNTL